MSGALAKCDGVKADSIAIDFPNRTAKVEVEGSTTDGEKLAAAINEAQPSFNAKVVETN